MQIARRSYVFVTVAALVGGLVWDSAVFPQSRSNQPAETYPFIGEVKGENVSVRAGPSVHFRRLGRLNAPARVIVLGRSYGWYKIRLPEGAEAYVAGEFLEETADEGVRVKAGRLNVRGGPGTTYGLLGQLKKGEAVTIVERRPDGWVRIVPSARLHAWMAADYVQWAAPFTPHDTPESVVSPTQKTASADRRAAEDRASTKRKKPPARLTFTGRLSVGQRASGGWMRARLHSAEGEETPLLIPSFAAMFDGTVVKVEAVACGDGALQASFAEAVNPAVHVWCPTRIEWVP